MTPRQRKPWSKVIEEMGVSVRLYERASGTIYRDVWNGDTRDRRSLGHADRKLAEQQARELAKRLAELHHAGRTGSVTFGQLVALYRQHRFPLLTDDRRRTVRGHLEILERHLARDRVVDDLSQHDVDGYTLARRSGSLESPNKRGEQPGVRDGTIRTELTTLMAVLNWGVVFRIGGRRLIAEPSTVRRSRARRMRGARSRPRTAIRNSSRSPIAPSRKDGCGSCSRSRATPAAVSTRSRTCERPMCCSRATRW